MLHISIINDIRVIFHFLLPKFQSVHPVKITAGRLKAGIDFFLPLMKCAIEECAND